MDAAIRVSLEKASDGRLIAEHAEQLDLGVGKLDEYGGHAVLGLVDLFGDLCAKRAPVDLGRGLQVWHGNGDMVQTANHRTVSPFGSF